LLVQCLGGEHAKRLALREFAVKGAAGNIIGGAPMESLLWSIASLYFAKIAELFTT